MKKFFLLLILNLPFVYSGFAQEAFYNAGASGVTISGLYASGKDFTSRGVGVMLLHQGKFFMGYEHDNVTLWIDEEFSDYYTFKEEFTLDGFFIGFRNYENPQKKMFFSTTFQSGVVISPLVSGINMIPIVFTIFKSISNNHLKIIPLIYGSYVYIFYKNRGGNFTHISTETAYGFQLNIAFRPINRISHGLALGLDYNLKNRDVPLSFQVSLLFNAFQVEKE